MSPDIKDLLIKDAQEREIIRKGMRKIKMRQYLTIFIGFLIAFMFFLNYTKLQEQIRKEDAVLVTLVEALHQGNILVKQADEMIKMQDSIIHGPKVREK